jgi:hypothetical protein
MSAAKSGEAPVFAAFFSGLTRGGGGFGLEIMEYFVWGCLSAGYSLALTTDFTDDTDGLDWP